MLSTITSVSVDKKGSLFSPRFKGCTVVNQTTHSTNGGILVIRPIGYTLISNFLLNEIR